MITFKSITALLMTAGISRLKLDFDDERKCVNVKYIFRGNPGTKQIAYQEIIDSLAIGLPEAPELALVDESK